jgi:hypothetical protein
MRATFLGSTPLTVLARCICGVKSYFDREQWQRLGMARCDNCRACIRYDSLEVVKFREGSQCMTNTDVSQGEVEELRQLELLLRDFDEHFQYQVAAAEQRGSEHHPFAPRTVKLMESAQPILRRLEEMRKLQPAA